MRAMSKISALCVALGFLALLPVVRSAEPAPDKAPALQTTLGVFLGIEQGDYAHWKLRKKNGKETTFFILRPDASVEKVLEKPEARVGQNCRVQWKKTTENIPEAGGKQVVRQIVSVEWLDVK
jgi:hypothetical protein